MNTEVTEAHFGIMVNGRVAEVQATAVHAVMALDEAHDHLVNARVVAMPPPSRRWYQLLDQFRSKAEAPESAPADSLGDVDEHAGRFAHELFVTAAAFLAAEANDLEDRVSLLAGNRQQGVIRARLDDIVNNVRDTADVLIGRIEDETWRELGKGVPSRWDAAKLDTLLQPTHLGRMQVVGRMAWSAAVGGATVAIAAFSVFGVFGGWSGPQNMKIMVGVVLLLCLGLGLLLGSAWTTQVLEAKTRKQADERRTLNEERSEIHTARQQLHTARQQLGERSRCTGRHEQDWYSGDYRMTAAWQFRGQQEQA